jgi:hypothetical protein
MANATLVFSAVQKSAFLLGGTDPLRPPILVAG